MVADTVDHESLACTFVANIGIDASRAAQEEIPTWQACRFSAPVTLRSDAAWRIVVQHSRHTPCDLSIR